MKVTEAQILVFDTETTGIDTAKDRIVEFGAIGVRGRVIGELAHNYVHPGMPIPKEAADIHGVTDEKVANEPPFSHIAGLVTALMERADVLCGYNAANYDAPLINAEFERHGFPFRIDPRRVLDPVIFVRWHLRATRERKLGAMCADFGVVLDNAHTAVADSTATGELLLKMVAAGYIPDDVEQALAEQARYTAVQESEFRRWSYWLYTDRKDGKTLRLGAGKYIGTPLARVDAGFLNWLLGKADEFELHAGAREEFAAELARRRGQAPRRSGVGLLRRLRG